MAVEKTAFISYRRASSAQALLINEKLKDRGYDVFIDVNSMGSGDFSQVLLNQIAARAHFIVILTPSTMERCAEPGDWIRKEIEQALELKRNIVPILFDNFNFKEVNTYLTGKLSVLPQFNSLKVDYDYFEAVINRLVDPFLNTSLDTILYPVPPDDEMALQKNADDVSKLSLPTNDQLHAEHCFEQGVLKILEYKLDEAIIDFTEAIRLNPNYDEAYYQRGRVYGNKKETQKSIADWEEAIRLEPDDIRVNITRSCIFREKGDFKRSLIEANAGVDLNPQSSDAYFQRGNVKRHLEDWDSAIADFTKAIELNPKRANLYHINRAITKSNKKDWDGAIEESTALIQSNSNLEIAYRTRAVAYREKGDLISAINDFTSLIQGNFQVNMTYNSRGFTYYMMRDLTNALTDCLKAVELDPKNKYALDSVGQIYFSMGDLERAQSYFNQSLTAEAEYESALAGLAACAYRLNQIEEAKAYWNRIIAKGDKFQAFDWFLKQSKPDKPLLEAANAVFALVQPTITPKD